MKSESSLPSSEDRFHFAAWDDLGAGAPTIIALATLCSRAMVSPIEPEGPLSLPARTILFAARNRGVLEIKGVYDAFSATARFLAVCVEWDEDHPQAFLAPEEPELTVQFLDGFRELCRYGLVMHHMYREFSLTSRGFEQARSIPADEVASLLSKFPREL